MSRMLSEVAVLRTWAMRRTVARSRTLVLTDEFAVALAPIWRTRHERHNSRHHAAHPSGAAPETHAAHRSAALAITMVVWTDRESVGVYARWDTLHAVPCPPRQARSHAVPVGCGLPACRRRRRELADASEPCAHTVACSHDSLTTCPIAERPFLGVPKPQYSPIAGPCARNSRPVCGETGSSKRLVAACRSAWRPPSLRGCGLPGPSPIVARPHARLAGVLAIAQCVASFLSAWTADAPRPASALSQCWRPSSPSLPIS
jgi:hypothetical protein